MSVDGFTAKELFDLVTGSVDFLLLDVRNPTEFARFKIEGPRPINMVNVPYMDFIEHEDESVAKVPRGKPIRAVCAKEGSSKFVAEILAARGYTNLGTCSAASRPGATCSRPCSCTARATSSISFAGPARLPAATVCSSAGR